MRDPEVVKHHKLQLEEALALVAWVAKKLAEKDFRPAGLYFQSDGRIWRGNGFLSPKQISDIIYKEEYEYAKVHCDRGTGAGREH